MALPLSLIVAVVAEMLMGGYGLGGAMMEASRFANSTGVFAGIVEIAVVGYCLVKAMSMIRRRLLIWHRKRTSRARCNSRHTAACTAWRETRPGLQKLVGTPTIFAFDQ